jgi:two-component system, NarL family, response regulator NreC
MSKITVVLADDHQLVRQGVRSLLEHEPDMIVVGEASDGLKTVELTARLKPQVLVVDLIMPGLSGVEVTRQLTKASPGTKVILLSMYMDEPYVIKALRYGAYGYVLKESNISDLIRAIREVTMGRHYLSPPLSERAVDAYLEKIGDGPLDLYDTLSTREREVLHLAVEGLGNAEIADRLYISVRTTEAHRTSMMRKLSLRGQTDLIKYAIGRGIIPRKPE